MENKFLTVLIIFSLFTLSLTNDDKSEENMGSEIRGNGQLIKYPNPRTSHLWKTPKIMYLNYPKRVGYQTKNRNRPPGVGFIGPLRSSQGPGYHHIESKNDFLNKYTTRNNHAIFVPQPYSRRRLTDNVRKPNKPNILKNQKLQEEPTQKTKQKQNFWASRISNNTSNIKSLHLRPQTNKSENFAKLNDTEESVYLGGDIDATKVIPKEKKETAKIIERPRKAVTPKYSLKNVNNSSETITPQYDPYEVEEISEDDLNLDFDDMENINIWDKITENDESETEVRKTNKGNIQINSNEDINTSEENFGNKKQQTKSEQSRKTTSIYPSMGFTKMQETNNPHYYEVEEIIDEDISPESDDINKFNNFGTKKVENQGIPKPPKVQGPSVLQEMKDSIGTILLDLINPWMNKPKNKEQNKRVETDSETKEKVVNTPGSSFRIKGSLRSYNGEEDNTESVPINLARNLPNQDGIKRGKVLSSSVDFQSVHDKNNLQDFNKNSRTKGGSNFYISVKPLDSHKTWNEDYSEENIDYDYTPDTLLDFEINMGFGSQNKSKQDHGLLPKKANHKKQDLNLSSLFKDPNEKTAAEEILENGLKSLLKINKGSSKAVSTQYSDQNDEEDVIYNEEEFEYEDEATENYVDEYSYDDLETTTDPYDFTTTNIPFTDLFNDSTTISTDITTDVTAVPTTYKSKDPVSFEYVYHINGLTFVFTEEDRYSYLAEETENPEIENFVYSVSEPDLKESSSKKIESKSEEPLIINLLTTFKPEGKNENVLETSWKNSRKMHFNHDPQNMTFFNYETQISEPEQRRSDILIGDIVEDYSENTKHITPISYSDKLAQNRLNETYTSLKNKNLDSVVLMIPDIIVDLKENKIPPEDLEILSQFFGSYWPHIVALSNVKNLDMLPLLKMKNEKDFIKVLESFFDVDLSGTTEKSEQETIKDYYENYNYMDDYDDIYWEVLNEKVDAEDEKELRVKRQQINNLKNVKGKSEEFSESVK